MRPIKSLLVALVGWSFIGAMMYLCACLTLFVIAALSQWPIDVFPLNHYQTFQYSRFRLNIWQYDLNCVALDNELIYRPREGACNFANLEFDTTLNFDARGRRVPARDQADASLPGIAVLGDSYAMGWGVEDAETFANVMQTRLPQPVFNLGVSSYGTERELKRLALSGLADKVNTVVILYCDNDVSENLALRTAADYAEGRRGFTEELQSAKGLQSIEDKAAWLVDLLDAVWVAPVEIPLRRLLNRPEYFNDSYLDFPPHADALRQTLRRYEGLLAGKQVYIAYVIPHGLRFNHYVAGRDSVLPAVTFLDAPWQPLDFFPIDGHLTATGHRHLGEWLATKLNQMQDRQP